MGIELEIPCSSSELISRGRLVCRCYRRVNDAVAFGRPPGSLLCTLVVARRQSGGGINYRVVLSDAAAEASAAQRPPESADFSCLADDWTVEAARPVEPPPPLRWQPAPQEPVDTESPLPNEEDPPSA